MTFAQFNWLNNRLGLEGQNVKFCYELAKKWKNTVTHSEPIVAYEFTPDSQIEEIDALIKSTIKRYVAGSYNFYLVTTAFEREHKYMLFDADKYNEEHPNTDAYTW